MVLKNREAITSTKKNTLRKQEIKESEKRDKKIILNHYKRRSYFLCFCLRKAFSRHSDQPHFHRRFGGEKDKSTCVTWRFVFNTLKSRRRGFFYHLSWIVLLAPPIRSGVRSVRGCVAVTSWSVTTVSSCENGHRRHGRHPNDCD